MADRPLPVQKLTLSPPALEELASSVRKGIQSNFTSTTVEITTPPDLRQSPYHLAAPGLSGNVRVADIGGQDNLRPGPNRKAIYNLLSISKSMEMSSGSGVLIGAGAGPFHDLGHNSELVANIAYGSIAEGKGTVNNATRYAQVLDDGSILCQKINSSLTGFALIGNLLGCDGTTGPMIHVTAKGRTGKRNFTESIRHSLWEVYGDKLISLGGVFVVRNGKVKVHVMPDFAKEPFKKPSDVNEWLKFYDVEAPLVCLGVLHSGNDQGLGLRVEHFHCFAGDGARSEERGGHYHYDVDDTRDEVEYEGWFNVAEVLYRIDPAEPVRWS